MKTYFPIYYDSEEAVSELSDEDVGKLLKALYAYASRGELPTFSGTLKTAWVFMKANVNRADSEYDRRCETSAKNGALGGRGHKKELRNDNLTEPNKPNSELGLNDEVIHNSTIPQTDKPNKPNINLESQDKTRQLFVNVVNNITMTNTYACARDLWITSFLKRLEKYWLDFYSKSFFDRYGTDEAIVDVINALANLHEMTDGVEVSKIKYSYATIEVCLDNIDTNTFSELILSMYEKGSRKIIGSIENYIFQILHSKLKAREVG